jgi:acetyl-CoA C-acetyltransferase
MRNKVAVIGVGCTAFGELYDKSATDLICEAAFEAIGDAGIQARGIGAAWVGSVLSPLGGDALGDALQLHNIPITRVQNYCASGLDAFRGACMAVTAGACDVALAVGFEKMRDGGFNRPARLHPVFDYGERAPHVFALAANRYFKRYGASKATLAKVAIKNHHHGTMSPKAHLRMEITEEKVLAAPLVYSPLGLFDCCPTTDGAAAAVICRADQARAFRTDPVYVKAVELAVASGQPYYKPSFDYTSFAATREAAARAYRNAGITPGDLDFAEVHDCFSITEIINCEDLGFCAPGEGGRFVEDGRASLEGGDLPVNPSGGLKSFGHPVGATGVRMIYELTLQLQQRAGARQVKQAELGLAHNLGGPAAVSAVAILGNAK